MMLVTAALILVVVAVQTSAYRPSYEPEYCTKNLNLRKIPPLTSEQAKLVSKLEQVQIIVRHGARTPWGKFSCWKDYDVVWNNCNVTELMLPSPSLTAPDRPATWLFRKIYDGSDNLLGGNCYTGQLISEGYNQENTIGRYLYNAYLNNPNSSLNLFNTSVWTDIPTDEQVYLRSDDEQRVLMSGQILLHSFFNISDEVIVPWHTGDYSLDQIYPNSGVCPRLDTVESYAMSTPEFVAENTSEPINNLNIALNSIFGEGYWDWYHVLDCMMTTVCTGNALPDGTDIPMTDSIFNATLDQVNFQEAYLNLYNDSQWAKLAMGNTAWHVRSNMENIIYNYSTSPNATNPLRLALFAGHDTTIMPFLAAVLKENWDRIWPSYAALVTIELYAGSASSTSPYLFRMVYNSVPQVVPGCGDTLCDAQILLDALAFGQEYMPCSTTEATLDTGCDSNDDGMSDGYVVLVAMMCTLFGLIVGGIATWYASSKLLMKGGETATSSTTTTSPMVQTTTLNRSLV